MKAELIQFKGRRFVVATASADSSINPRLDVNVALGTESVRVSSSAIQSPSLLERCHLFVGLHCRMVRSPTGKT